MWAATNDLPPERKGMSAATLRYNLEAMKRSTELAGVLVVIVVLFAIPLVTVASSPTTRLLIAALVITIGGGIMAFLRSRREARR
jgi:hypothetical protein